MMAARQRLVRSEGDPEPRQVLDAGVRTGEHAGGVAGRQPDEHEGDRGHHQHHRDHGQHPMKEIGFHGRAPGPGPTG